MVASSKRLQIEGLYTYQLQEFLMFHRHKKPEFLLGLVFTRAFLLLFLDRLLPKKSKKATDNLSCFSQRDNKEEANLQAENTCIFHWLQFLLTNISLLQLSFSRLNASVNSNLSPLHKIFFCRTYVFL